MIARQRRVVVGVDGSPASELAASWAADHAADLDLPLELVHAVPVRRHGLGGHRDESDERAAGESLLHSVAGRVRAERPGVEVSTWLGVAAPAALLLDRAADAETLVLGARVRGGFAGLQLGSTGAQVAGTAPCPVVLVRGKQGSGVVVGVDSGPTGGPAVAFAFAFAAATGEPLIAVHAWLPAYVGGVDVPYLEEPEPAAESEAAHLSEGLAGWCEQYPDVEVRTLVRPRHPVPALVEASSEARLLVVGSHGRGGFAGVLLGSVSHALLQHAPCTLAVVRGPSRLAVSWST